MPCMRASLPQQILLVLLLALLCFFLQPCLLLVGKRGRTE